MRLATLASNGERDKLRAAVLRLGRERGGDWQRYGKKLAAFLKDGVPRFTVFREGNSKLPFFQFSALPILTCPGFGDCGKYCYSFKGWRYPAALYRQIQNTILVKFQRATLAAYFAQLPQGVVVRLYVDGDIDSMGTLRFWFQMLEARPDLKAYGYSKSWPLFLSYAAKGGTFPANYRLNISGGSRFGGEMLEKVKALPCVRGEFLAFPVATREKADRAQYRRELKQAAKAAGLARHFVCPGKCGECANGAHACGSDKFKGVPVVIGIH